MLVIKNVSKTFASKPIINALSLTVARGEIAVLLGPSGVGKSTLLRILSSLETAEHGTIQLDNKPLTQARMHNDHLVGMVFQGFNLFEHLTVERNITLALEKVLNMPLIDAQKRTHELLHLYGLADKKYVFPHNLSGGQKQRLAIARALALKPAIICLDEPTSALDPLLTAHIAHTIQGLAKQNYIVLVACHDTDLLKKLECTIYLMDQGTIVEKASSHQLHTNPTAHPRIAAFVSGQTE